MRLVPVFYALCLNLILFIGTGTLPLEPFLAPLLFGIKSSYRAIHSARILFQTKARPKILTGALYDQREKKEANIERCFCLNSELNVREAFCCGHTHGCFRGCGFSNIDRKSFNIFDACYEISFDLLAIQVRFIKHEHSIVKEYPNLHINALIFIVQYFFILSVFLRV